MQREELFESLVLSLTRWVEDFRAAEMAGSEYVNWDGHANINELPQKDIIGLAGVGFAEDRPKNYQVVFGILVSTWDDPGLHRLTKLVSKLDGRLWPEKNISLYKPAEVTLIPGAWMQIVLPRAVTPVSKAEVRAVQGVERHALVDPGVGSSLR